MSTQLETLGSALKVFGSEECYTYTTVAAAPTNKFFDSATTTLRCAAPSVSVYGDKIVLLNFASKDAAEDGGGAITAKMLRSAREEDSDARGGGGAGSPPVTPLPALQQSRASTAAGAGAGVVGAGVGVIIFHIDNTSSMLREQRMQLVKNVLKRVIPPYLRLGYRIIINAWASTEENAGRIQSRELVWSDLGFNDDGDNNGGDGEIATNNENEDIDDEAMADVAESEMSRFDDDNATAAVTTTTTTTTTATKVTSPFALALDASALKASSDTPAPSSMSKKDKKTKLKREKSAQSPLTPRKSPRSTRTPRDGRVLSEEEKESIVQKYIEEVGFAVLQPKGRTDLYGSCFQLLRQCRRLIRTGTMTDPDEHGVKWGAANRNHDLSDAPSTAPAAGPIFAFVLTDGEHNKLDYPLHRPEYEGEMYFDVYTVEKPDPNNKVFRGVPLRFIKNGNSPSVGACELQLRRELDTLNRDSGGSSSSSNLPVSMTLIGIGEAETKPLSDLAEVLGNGCCFYGITEVGQSDAVFANIQTRSSSSSALTLLFDNGAAAATTASSGGVEIEDGTQPTTAPTVAITFSWEEADANSNNGMVVHGCSTVLADTVLAEHIHQCSALSVKHLDAPAVALSAASSTVVGTSIPGDDAVSVLSNETERYQEQLTKELRQRVSEFVSELRTIRPIAYEVNEHSFSSVFRQLMADRKSLQQLKNSFFSKHTRRLRKFSLFAGLGIWIKELESLVDSQIASYRMNVEGEILSKLTNSASFGMAGGSAAKHLQPTQMVLYRLQNNLRNAGKASHRVVKHVAAISSIRNRTMHIAGVLFGTTLSLHYLYLLPSSNDDATTASDAHTSTGILVGIRLVVRRGDGKTMSTDWVMGDREASIGGLNNNHVDIVQQIVAACTVVAEPMLYGSSSDTTNGGSSSPREAGRGHYLLSDLRSSRTAALSAAATTTITATTKTTTTSTSGDGGANDGGKVPHQYQKEDRYVMKPVSGHSNRNTATVGAEDDGSVVFPCVLLVAKFNQFSIIRATHVFYTVDIVCGQPEPGVSTVGSSSVLNDHSSSSTNTSASSSSSSSSSTMVPVVYCAEELWELCHASNHNVGDALPIHTANVYGATSTTNPASTGTGTTAAAAAAAVAEGANMILPLAYTPLLFKLYVERGRAYHSAINVTGDCMALTVVSLQWAKFFHDVLLARALSPSKDNNNNNNNTTGPSTSASVPTEKRGDARAVMWMDQAMKAAVAFHFCIESWVMLPSKASLMSMFGCDEKEGDAKTQNPEAENMVFLSSKPKGLSSTGSTSMTADAAAAAVEPKVVMSRDDCPGLTCAIAIAALVAGSDLPYANSVHSWNLLMRTLFSRLCEAIAGQKIVRNSTLAAADVTAAASTTTQTSSSSSGKADTTTTTAAAKTGVDAGPGAAGSGAGSGGATTPTTAAAAVCLDPAPLEDSYRHHLGRLQGLLRKRLYREWSKLCFTEKCAHIAACDNKSAILTCLQEVVRLFLRKLDGYGLHSWTQVSGLVMLALRLKHHGIAKFRSQLADGSSSGANMQLLAQELLLSGQNYTKTAPYVLPVFRDNSTTPSVTSGENGVSSFSVHEMSENDVPDIVLYIDAIVATKASPKFEYVPVNNPTFPVLSTADNQSLHVRPATLEWDESLPHANIAFIGNISAGKSSISGRLLSSLGLISQQTLYRLGKEAEKLGYSADVKHAWIMDRLSEERGGNFTIENTWGGFQTNNRRFTIIDNPGHRNLVKKACYGIFEADVVVLVIPADIKNINYEEKAR